MKNEKKKNDEARKPSAYSRLGNVLAATAARLVSAAPARPEDDPAPRATLLLVHQHRKLEKLLEKLKSADGDVDATLRELADDLSAHIAIEEEIFYPAVRELDVDIVLEGLEEHAMGRFALNRLLGTKASDEALAARVAALAELMKNHHREEENDLFPKVHRAMSKDELVELGATMKNRFDACVASGHEAVLAGFDDDLRKPVRAKSAKPREPAKKKATAKAKAKARPTRAAASS